MPINFITKICFDKVIALQSALTNRALLNVIRNKFEVQKVFSFLRKHFLCGNGELVNQFLESIVTKNGDINRNQLLYSANTLFEDGDIRQILTPKLVNISMGMLLPQ